MRLSQPPLFARLASSERILLAGMGGGFDVFCGLPLYRELVDAGKQVFLSNLTFSNTRQAKGRRVADGVVEVTADSAGSDTYFPERYLSEWFRQGGEEVPVYCIDKAGGRGVAASYAAVVEDLGVDTVVLVDGGTDSLMRGDEAGLGTPHEDMLSLAAVDDLVLDGPKLLVCLGFGVDAFHGVCHAHFLENTAALSQRQGFLGALSLLREMPSVQQYIEAVDYANGRMPRRASIVNSSIASALEGCYGNHHRTDRTPGSELWINPLMGIYWTYDATAVARRVLYLEPLKQTNSFFEVLAMVDALCGETMGLRQRKAIPV